MSVRAQVGTVILLVGALCGTARPCSLTRSFHQVTAIQGKVVGVNLHDSLFAPFQYWRWVRQRTRKAALVSLYKYEPGGWQYRTPISTTKTDSDGWFQLRDIPQGHYTMTIADAELKDWFDVEVTDT